MKESKALPSEMRDRERGLLLSDRLNPLLVRDLQQSFAGRGFVAALVLALLAMLVVASLALDVDGDDRGPRALSIVLFALGVMVNIVVPLQAFQGTRQEMLGGTADQLLLSSLSPATIVRGKLLAAAVKLLVWISLFSPLVALTWLLRGLSVAQIALAIFTVSLSGLALCGLGVVLGSLTVFKRVTTLVHVVSSLLLAGGGLGMCLALAASNYLWLRLGSAIDALQVLLVLAVIAVMLLGLFILLAQSQFTHPHENRSTGFRLYLPVAIVIGWLLAAGTAGSDLDEALPVISLMGLGIGWLFFVFAATEERKLSPRVRSLVPATPGRALLVAPLLPGGGRGLLWTLLVALLLVMGPELFAAIFSVKLDDELSNAVFMAATYAVLHAALGCLVRSRLRAGPSGTWSARLIVIGVVVLGMVASTLTLVLQHGAPVWNVFQLLNPFWTIGVYADGNAPAAMVVMVIALIAALVVSGPVMAEGVREIDAARDERRQRAR